MSAGDAAIEIVTPRPGATIRSDTTQVEVRVRGFRLAADRNLAPERGRGHLVFYSGASYQVPTAQNLPATSGGSGNFTAASSAKAAYRWSGLEPGRWMFAAQLVGSDDAPLVPPRFASVVVEVSP
jgi:hypothetical protein